MKSILSNTLVFFYIYSISFKVLPAFLETRVLFAIFGILLCILKVVANNEAWLNKKIAKYLCIAFFLPVATIISSFTNQTLDLTFVIYFLKIVATSFAAYFLIYMLYKLDKDLNFLKISNIIINTLFLQALLSLVMYLLPTFKLFLLNIQHVEDFSLLVNFGEFRLIGFGAVFFGSGIINGFGLILISLIIKKYHLTARQLSFISLKYLTILIIGLMMARTVFIGAILSFLLVTFPHDRYIKIKPMLYFFIAITIIPILLITSITYVFPSLQETLKPAIEFAFEMFINYQQAGSFESASTNRLQEMYIFPYSIKTWIIGDGYWNNPFGQGYYMHTDVGYLRLLYYFGTLGLITFFLFQIYLIFAAFKKFNTGYQFIIILSIYILVLNLKGLAELSNFTLLYIFAILLFEKHRDSKNENIGNYSTL